jgi:hypothetical protein
MTNYEYIGVVKYQNNWRIFADNSSRKTWGLIKRFEDYTASFAELSPADIQNNLSVSWISFVVNFDEKVFVDNDGDDTYFLPVKDSLPSDWQYWADNPIFYIPESISSLWIGKLTNVEDGMIQVSPASFAAIRSENTWRFFMGFDETWILDFVSFMNRPTYPAWPSARVYSDFRKASPFVDETNKADYLQKLKDFELSAEEIPKLRLALNDDQRFQLAIWKEDVERYSGTNQAKNIQILIDSFTKPLLTAFIDFDRKVCIHRNKIFAPVHWSQRLANPISYLPDGLRDWWR